MRTVELEIEMDNELLAKTRKLAVEYFGDDEDASLALILEAAFKMRCLWSSLIVRAQQETDEAISTWEFPHLPVTDEESGIVRSWLFRR